jgi:NADH-quinone oxidoreductase subunit J
MSTVFYISALVAVVSTAMVITRSSAIHALLYLIVSLLAVAVVFFVLGAPFVAALEVIIYAGAIMVLFVFVVMMLDLAPTAEHAVPLLPLRAWIGPAVLGLILIVELAYVLLGDSTPPAGTRAIEPKEAAVALFGPYLLGVELGSLLLLAGIVGACRLGRRSIGDKQEEHGHGRHPA